MSVVWEACDNGVPSLGYPQKFHEAQKLLTFGTETWLEKTQFIMWVNQYHVYHPMTGNVSYISPINMVILRLIHDCFNHTPNSWLSISINTWMILGTAILGNHK